MIPNTGLPSWLLRTIQLHMKPVQPCREIRYDDLLSCEPAWTLRCSTATATCEILILQEAIEPEALDVGSED